MAQISGLSGVQASILIQGRLIRVGWAGADHTSITHTLISTFLKLQ
jgi:hypothetical protein